MMGKRRKEGGRARRGELGDGRVKKYGRWMQVREALDGVRGTMLLPRGEGVGGTVQQVQRYFLQGSLSQCRL